MQRGIFYTDEELEFIERSIQCMDADIGSLWNREEIWKNKTDIKMILCCLTRDISNLKSKLID